MVRTRHGAMLSWYSLTFGRHGCGIRSRSLRHGAILLWYPLRALGGSGYSGSYSSYKRQLPQVEHKHSRPQRGRRRPQRAVLCPGSVGAMLTSAEGRAHAHWPARRNAAVYGDLRRTSAKAAPPSPPWPSGGQCRARSSHAPASAAHAVASWRVRRLWVQCARRG